MEKDQKFSPSNKPEETSTVRIVSSTPKSVVFRTMENSSSNDVLRNYTTGLSWASSEDYLNYSLSPFNNNAAYGNGTDLWIYFPNSTVGNLEKKISCQWEAAQHNLFQFSNMCFLSAFVIPRNYKSSVLLFRYVQFGFLISLVLKGVKAAAVDILIVSNRCLKFKRISRFLFS